IDNLIVCCNHTNTPSNTILSASKQIKTTTVEMRGEEFTQQSKNIQNEKCKSLTEIPARNAMT
uniref:Uncharacterized protein n=1 Tax=Romanomermis culicivorax TaxID=13658 RepID=A0A915KUP4_ROMCU